MATIPQRDSPPTRSLSPHPGPMFRGGNSTVKSSPAKYAALANNSRSGSFEAEGSSSARQLLRNVKQEDEQDADHMQPPKKRRPFVKKSPSPSHLTPGSSTSVSKHYNRLGILYSSSPDPGCGFSPPNFPQGAPNESPKFGGLLGVSSTATLPPGLSTDVRLREGYSVATASGGGVSTRPASFHSGMRMAVNQRMIPCESGSTGDLTARDVGAKPEAVGGGTEAVGRGSPMEHGSPDIKASVFLSSGTIQQDPSPPISLTASASRVDKPGATSASSPDSGYGNTPENNPGTANVPEGESPSSRLQVQTTSEQLQERGTSDELAVDSDCRVIHHEFSPEAQEMNTSQTGHQTGQTGTAITVESTHLRTMGPERDPIEITLEDHSDRDTQPFRPQINQPLPPRSDSIPPGSNSIPPRSDPMFCSVESSLDWGGMRPFINNPVVCVDIEDSATNLPHRLKKKGLPRTPSVPEYLFARVNSESTAHSSSPPDPSSSRSQATVSASASVQYMQYNRVSREFALARNSPTGSPKFPTMAADSPKAMDEEDEAGFSGLGQFRDRAKHVGSSREILEKLEAAVAKGRRRSHSQPVIKATDVRGSGQAAAGDGGGAGAAAEEKDYFQVTDELAKENSHFAISEALLAVIEQYKANCAEQLEELPSGSIPAESEDMPDHAPLSPVQPTSPSPQTPTYVGPSGVSSWGSSESSPTEASLMSNVALDSPRRSSRVSLLELIQSPAGDNSAESTAQRLLQHVAVQLTGSHGQELSMSQLVLQLPTDFLNSLQLDEDLQKSVTTSSAHMRGSKEWAPPRAQIIFHIRQPSKNIQKDLVAQGYRCTGCGMKVEPSHVRYFRFCNYTGKYFCQNCHSNAVSMIPAYVIEKWSFKKYSVSNFARDLLVKIHHHPAFNVQSVNRHIYSRVPAMVQARELRKQLIAVKNYLKSCRRAQSLNITFEGYAPWTTDVHTYSMDDFVQLKNGTKMKYLRALLADSIKHIKECPVCEGKGFVCEFCRNTEDIIYPFQINRVSVCKVCQCCFHKECFSNKLCPRCIRVEERQRQRLRKMAFEVEQEEILHDNRPR